MPLLPPGSCDTHLHLFGAIARYPMRHPKPLYQISPDWTLEALRKMHASLGITRYVAVQPTAYTNDHSCMIDMLAAEMPDTARGVAIIDDTIDDKTIARMHEVGVRGARFNFQSRFGLVPSFEEFHRSVARIRPYGWIIKIFVMDELPDVEKEIRKARMTTVIDHLGPRQDFAQGITHPHFRLALDLIKGEGWWSMISNGHRRSAQGAPFDDIVPFGQALYDAAPDRTLWSTDWPHVTETRPTNEADTVALLKRYLPDEAALAKVMVDNPARLYGFAR